MSVANPHLKLKSTAVSTRSPRLLRLPAICVVDSLATCTSTTSNPHRATRLLDIYLIQPSTTHSQHEHLSHYSCTLWQSSIFACACCKQLDHRRCRLPNLCFSFANGILLIQPLVSYVSGRLTLSLEHVLRDRPENGKYPLFLLHR